VTSVSGWSCLCLVCRSWSRGHRSLRSFPTRRSSDLGYSQEHHLLVNHSMTVPNLSNLYHAIVCAVVGEDRLEWDFGIREGEHLPGRVDDLFPVADPPVDDALGNLFESPQDDVRVTVFGSSTRVTNIRRHRQFLVEPPVVPSFLQLICCPSHPPPLQWPSRAPPCSWSCVRRCSTPSHAPGGPLSRLPLRAGNREQ